jgi:hypothetical protein
MKDHITKEEKALIKRLEIISHGQGGKGREYSTKNIIIEDFNIQDDGETLKIFTTNRND